MRHSIVWERKVLEKQEEEGGVCPSTAHLPRPTAPYTPLPLGVAHALLIVTFGSFHMYPSTPHLPRPTRDSGGEEEEEGWACISTSKVTYPCEYVIALYRYIAIHINVPLHFPPT